MAMKKSALGKGLSALIGEENLENNLKSKEISIDDIFPNKKQPRKKFDEEKINALSYSIENHGVIQPILVKKEGDFYKIIAGERRWRAAKKAGLKTIPIIEKNLDEIDITEISLIENIQRENLNPIEEAMAYERLSKEFKLTQEDISHRVGKSRTAITNSMRLLKLHSDVIQYIIEDKLSEGHGKILAGIENKEIQLKISEKIIKEELNVRETEKLIRELNNSSKEKPHKEEKDVHTKYTEERLKEVLGTKVNINTGKNKSKIEIEFYSQEDLNRLLDLLLR